MIPRTPLSHYLQHLRFILKKPRVLPRALGGVVQTRLLGRRRLRTIDWAMTYHCNSNCSMCSAKLLMSNPAKRGQPYLTPEQIGSVWRQAVELGALHVNLTGGEPTLRTDDELDAIIRAINGPGALVSMVTNTISLTRERLARFQAAGLDTLQLSVESLDPAVHDSIRRSPGNWQKLMTAFRWAQELDLLICLSIVLEKGSFAEAERLRDFAVKENAFFLLNPLSASGAMAGDRSRSIGESDRERYYALLFSSSLVRADTLLNFRGGHGCPAGVERIEITAFGDVMTCPHVQVHYGNVLEEPLAKIYRRISGFPYLREFQRDCRHIFNADYVQRIMEPIRDCRQIPVSIFDHPVAREPEIKAYLDSTR